jgi:hypothetical protein
MDIYLQITQKMIALKENAKGGAYPSDKQINELADLLYQRDKKQGPDTEMLGVARGVVQGMQIMRSILEH